MSPLSKSELKRQIKLFLQDPNRGISQKLFSDICGVSLKHMMNVFVKEEEPLTETVQIRVNKGYAEWKNGNIRLMKRPDNTMYADYRRESKPAYLPAVGLQATSEGFKIRIGPKNRHDYSDRTLDEQLRG